MLREVAFLFLGGLIILGDAVDVLWTTLGTHGGGPISGRVTDVVWKAFLAIHKRRPNHQVLSFAGTFMLVMLLVLWTTLLWSGWLLVFSAKPGAVIETQSHAPADLPGRVFFTGYLLSTLGNGDFMPSGGGWRVLAAFASLGGLGILTLTVTFLMNVLPGVVHQRTLGAYLTDLGGTPQRIVQRSWDGESFDGLVDHLQQLTGMVHLFTEHHLAYPVLHYFHSEKERTAASLRLAGLYDLLVLLTAGLHPDKRLGPQETGPIEEALRGLRDVLSTEYVDPAEHAPPPPALAILRERGIPTVDDDEYARTLLLHDETRRFFAGFLRDDGRRWERVNGN